MLLRSTKCLLNSSHAAWTSRLTGWCRASCGTPVGVLHARSKGTSGFPPASAQRQPWRSRVSAASGEVGPGHKKPKRGGSGSRHQQQQGEAGSQNGPVGLRGREEFDDEDDEDEDNILAPYMNAVVKVFCVHTEPNFSLPWQRKRQYTSSSSGFVVSSDDKRWLLTNAHSVDYHTQVKVKKRGDDRKFLARVLSIGVDCDVALLTVDDDEFWEGVQTIDFGPLPRLQDSVAVVGYPIGGDTISITVGVVSRIEVTEYSHGSTDLLGVQIDAAINGGNSGGPVFDRNGRCIGLAFQALSGSDVENVGYVIPTPVVSHFLSDYVNTGGFSGFPIMGIQWQRMESEALRRAYKMAPKQKGVLVRRVNPTSPAAAFLRPDDVLLSFDGTAIACDGTVPFRTGERIAFSYLISNKFVGDTAVLEVLRDGQLMKFDVKLSKPTQLVPPHLSNADPAYFLVSGLVFTTANEPYLESEYGEEYISEAPVKLLERLYHGLPQEVDEQVVVLSQVLANDVTLGYESTFNVQVMRLNGERVRNLRHLAELVIANTEPYLRFDLEYDEAVIVDAHAAVASTAEVLAAHSIPHAMSTGLRAELPEWPPAAAAAGAAKPAAAAAAAAAGKRR